MLGFCSAVLPLWNLRIEEYSDARFCEGNSEFLISGSIANAALFFIYRYYCQYFTPKTPVAKLIMLAAHAVLTASKFNPEGIQGLEMVICEGNTFKTIMPSDAIHTELRERSEELDRLIAERISVPVAAVTP